MSTLNVKDFGAVGDGTADDTAAIQAADAAAVRAGIQSSLLFPSGTYKITLSTTIASPIDMQPGALLAPSVCTVTLAGGLVNPSINYHIFDGTGSISSVAHQGTGPADGVTVTGNPQGIFQGFEISITTGGPRGTAIFKYKYWYFDTGFITDQTTAVDFNPIAGTGITLHFADVTYSANDTYTFNISPPVIFSASPGRPLNVKWFGAVGDSTTDDTGALQTAIGVARGFFGLAVSDLYFPAGTYKITRTLYAQTWTIGAPLRFIGQYYGSNLGASVIIWAGPDGDPMWVMWNQTNGIMEHLRFSATSSIEGSIVHAAKNCVVLSENPTQPTALGSATDTYIFRDCQFAGASGTGSANVLLGNGVPFDVSQVYFEHCRFDTALDAVGAEQTNYNVAFDGGGNTKDFFLTDCQFAGCKLAHVYANMNGVLSITNGVGGSNSVLTQHGCQLASFYIVTCEQMIVNGWESEGDARLLYCEASGFNHTSILLKAVNWNGGSVDASTLAAPSPTLQTTVASSSEGVMLEQTTTINVASTFIAKSTYTFPPAGAMIVLSSDGLQTVTYNGITPTSLLNCSGGTGKLSAGNPVVVARVTSFAQLDVAAVALCSLSIEGCSIRNLRSGVPTISPSNIMVSSDAFRSTSGAFYSCGNFYEGSTVLPIITTNGLNLITNGFYRAQDLNIVSRNDFGSNPVTGALYRLPVYEGRDLQNGRQQLLNENANAAVVIVTSGNLAHSIARFDVDWTQVKPITGAAFAFALGELPNRARIINVLCKTTQGWSGLGLGNVCLSIGDGADLQSYVLAKDITIPMEIGTRATDLGPLLNAVGNLAYGHLTSSTPVVLSSTLLYAQIQAKGGTLSSLNAGHTEIHITFEVLPASQYSWLLTYRTVSCGCGLIWA